MTKPKFAPASGPTPASKLSQLEIGEAASASAPFIYFEEVPTYGHTGDNIRLTLSAVRIYPGNTPNSVHTDRVLVAHLRTNLLGAHTLRDILDRALLMADPPKAKSGR